MPQSKNLAALLFTKMLRSLYFKKILNTQINNLKNTQPAS